MKVKLTDREKLRVRSVYNMLIWFLNYKEMLALKERLKDFKKDVDKVLGGSEEEEKINIKK